MDQLKLTARTIKATLVLDPNEIAALPPISGADAAFVIDVGGQRITGRFNPKSVRKCIATIKEAGGPANVAVIAQGKLVGNRLEEAGIVAQVKTPKPGQS